MISERIEILKGLRAGPLVLRRLVRGLDDAALRLRPAAGEWAIIEVVAHLADTDERSLDRTRRMLEEDEPTLAPYDPHALSVERDYIGMDIAAELDRFEARRQEQADVLDGLTGDQWQRVGVHGEHGRITIQQLAAHTVGEDADHFAQIARLIPVA